MGWPPNRQRLEGSPDNRNRWYPNRLDHSYKTKIENVIDAACLSEPLLLVGWTDGRTDRQTDLRAALRCQSHYSDSCCHGEFKICGYINRVADPTIASLTSEIGKKSEYYFRVKMFLATKSFDTHSILVST